MAEDAAFALNNKFISDLQELHGGDLNKILVSVINAQINVLSSIHGGDVQAVATVYMANAKGVVSRLMDGSVELATGPRH